MPHGSGGRAPRLVARSDDRTPYSVGVRSLARGLVAEADGDFERAATDFEAATGILRPLSVPLHA
jgi:hypothetical protein